MNISKYRAFLKIAATGSFSQAAEQLHCTQSAASRMILDLENYWGFKLFSRIKGGAVLTPEGEALFPLIERLVLAESDIQAAATAFSHLTRGIVRIGTFSSVATVLLPSVIKAFKEKYPEVNYEILMGDYGEIENWVKSGRVDFGFTSPEIDEGLESVLVMKDDMMLAVHESHPFAKMKQVPVRLLNQEPFFLLEKGRPGPVTHYLNKEQIIPNTVLTTFEDYTIVNMIGMGLGCGILPRLVLQRSVEHVCYKQLVPKAQREILLVVREGKHLPLAAKEFLKCFSSELIGRIDPAFELNINKYLQ